MSNGRPVTNSDLFDRLNSIRLEAKGDTIRLEIEIAAIRGAVTKLEIKGATFAGKMAILGFITAMIAGPLVSIIALRLMGTIK